MDTAGDACVMLTARRAFSARCPPPRFDVGMEKLAPQLCTSAADIARIEQRASALASGTRVRIGLIDGKVIDGMVAEQPVVQLFKDAEGNEGMNAVVRLEDAAVPLWTAYLWLSDIATVQTMDIS